MRGTRLLGIQTWVTLIHFFDLNQRLVFSRFY